ECSRSLLRDTNGERSRKSLAHDYRTARRQFGDERADCRGELRAGFELRVVLWIDVEEFEIGAKRRHCLGGRGISRKQQLHHRRQTSIEVAGGVLGPGADEETGLLERLDIKGRQ